MGTLGVSDASLLILWGPFWRLTASVFPSVSGAEEMPIKEWMHGGVFGHFGVIDGLIFCVFDKYQAIYDSTVNVRNRTSR